MSENVVAYVMFEKEFLKLKEIHHKHKVGEDGQLMRLALNNNDKVLYKFMQDRYEFFKQEGKQYFDNQDELAEYCGMSKRTVVNIIDSFVEFGLVEKKAKKLQGAMHSNSYVVHDIFDTTKFVTGSNVKVSLQKNKTAKKQPANEEEPKQQSTPQQNWYENENTPF